jgi:hypothetical protein
MAVMDHLLPVSPDDKSLSPNVKTRKDRLSHNKTSEETSGLSAP